MALETYRSLVCDRCKARSEEFEGEIFTLGMMLGELRQLGWRRCRGGRLTDEEDVCPTCNPHFKSKAGAR